MRLIDAQIDEFKDPAKIKAMDQREVVAVIEVFTCFTCTHHTIDSLFLIQITQTLFQP